jgi:hypothetical protein
MFINAGTIAYILQICFVYWFAVLWKSAPEWRSEFTAVEYALNADPLASPVAIFLRQFKWLCYTLTIMTMIVEAGGPLLVLFPFATQWTRLLAVVTFIGLHAGFGICLVLGNFAPVCWVGWIALMPPLFWDGLSRWCNTRWRSGHSIRTALPAEQAGWLESLRSLLLIPSVALMPGQVGQGSGWWVAAEAGTSTLTGAAAMRRLLWLSPVFWVLAWMPDSILAWIGRRFGQPDVPAPDAETYREHFLAPYRAIAVNTLVFFCLVYVFVWNVRTVAPEAMRRAFPQTINGIGVALAFDQSHGVFAPAPGKFHGWYVLAARLQNGDEIDLHTGTAPTDKQPEYIYLQYRNSRWRRVLQSMASPLYSSMLPYYVDWERREWNRKHPEKPIVVLDLWYFARVTDLNHPAEAKKSLLYRLTTRGEDRETKR